MPSMNTSFVSDDLRPMMWMQAGVPAPVSKETLRISSLQSASQDHGNPWVFQGCQGGKKSTPGRWSKKPGTPEWWWHLLLKCYPNDQQPSAAPQNSAFSNGWPGQSIMFDKIWVKHVVCPLAWEAGCCVFNCCWVQCEKLLASLPLFGPTIGELGSQSTPQKNNLSDP
jgi:hypothetical protein